MALGLLASAFARTEFQAVQFMPAFVPPQFLLCGLLTPRDQLPDALDAVSRALPLSYAVDAMTEIAGEADPAVAIDLLIVAGCCVVALAAGAVTLRRRTA
jgi:ABC-2 type transport system permease protein